MTKILISNTRKLLIALLSFIFIINLAIFLDIPFLRQILGFLFLTILPGLLILQIIRLNEIGFTEKFVLSVGLSVSFLMFFGLLINNLSLSLGYETPLATIPLLISFNLAFIVLAIIGYKINKTSILSLPDINLSTSEKAFLIVPILFPALSIFGMHLMNTTDNNIILMFLLFLIPTYVASVCFCNHKFPKRLYPVVIFLIGISLLLLMSLRSNHIIGVDIHQEYYFFRTTLNNLSWSVFGHSTLDACLAISLLPTIYQSILNIAPEFLYKILYSLLFSISPLIVYILSKKYIGELYGFLASCFFMFQQYFLFAEFYPRTFTAVLFLALAMLVLFNDKIDPLKKRILFIVFMASCMVSHYATTYIFFFIMLGTFIGLKILSKKYTVKKVVSLTITILFFALIFFWYSQVTEAAFNSGVRFIGNTLSNLNKFFVEEMRSSTIQSVMGEGIGEKGIPYKIEFVLIWLTFIFIGIGIITLIRRYKEMSVPELNLKKPDFLKDTFEVGYFMIALCCAGLLVVIVALPFVSTGYGMIRLYAVAATILSVFFVIGGITVSRRLKVRAYLVILLMLIPYFLCVTGVTYQIFGVPRAIVLNSEGEHYDMYYMHDQESHGAMWLVNYAEQENIKIHTDWYGQRRLISQAGFLPRTISRQTLTDERNREIRGYIYLRYYNVVDGKLLDKQFEEHDMTQYETKFAGKNKIYNNGGAEVWK